jgi:polyisoprenoid-binding protein YceI
MIGSQMAPLIINRRFPFLLIFFLANFANSETILAGTWQWDIARGNAEVRFEGTGRPSMLKITGIGKKPPSGALTFNGKSATGDFSFDLNSLDTGIETRNTHMKKKYLEIDKFPTAKLQIVRMTLANEMEGAGTVINQSLPFEGKLDLHGTTKPIRGVVELSGSRNNLSLKCSFSLKVTDFGISIPSFAGITMAENVEVVVNANAPTLARK